MGITRSKLFSFCCRCAHGKISKHCLFHKLLFFYISSPLLVPRTTAGGLGRPVRRSLLQEPELSRVNARRPLQHRRLHLLRGQELRAAGRWGPPPRCPRPPPAQLDGGRGREPSWTAHWRPPQRGRQVSPFNRMWSGAAVTQAFFIHG